MELSVIFNSIITLYILAFPITVIVNQISLRRYRKRMIRNMNQIVGAQNFETPGQVDSIEGQVNLRINEVSASASYSSSFNTLANAKTQALSATHIVFGFVFGFVLTVLVLYADGIKLEDDVRIGVLLLNIIAFFLPILTIYYVINGKSRQFGLFMALYFILPLLLVVASRQLGIGDYLLMLFVYGVMPFTTYLIIHLGNQKSIASINFILVFSLLSMAILMLPIGYYLLIPILQLGRLGFYTIVVLVLVLCYFITNRILINTLADWYKRKIINDWIIQFVIIWLVLGLSSFILKFLANEQAGFVMVVFFVFFMYLLAIDNFISKKKWKEHTGYGLLYLRIFSEKKKSKKLFQFLTKKWRWIGPVYMIGGPDTALLYINPTDYLKYLLRKSTSQFIKSEQEMELRMESIDDKSDRDGRFRINNFYCFSNIWKATVSNLFERSRVVVIDIRDFNLRRRGVLFEIEQLVKQIPLSLVVFVYDSHTKIDSLINFLNRVSHELPANSPNISEENSVVNLYKLEETNEKRVDQFTRYLSFLISDEISSGIKSNQ